ncbi:hypothetical protein MXB_4129 [Myxobolus squamalis]|nr:hypothetical protein MXB_4129 [Myxobolus squamalis]
MWIRNEGLVILCMGKQVFIDSIFKATFMDADPTCNRFVPCTLCLMTARNKFLYCTVLHEILVLLEYLWRLKVVIVDFEANLLKAVHFESKN